MRKRLLALLLVASITSAMAATTPRKPTMAPPAVPVFTADKPYVAITSSNASFVLKLKSNPTTGYAWYLRDYDDDLIVPIKRDYQKPETNLAGAPGFELWTFKVKPSAFVVPQQTAIRMVYARAFSGENVTPLMFTVSTSSSAN